MPTAEEICRLFYESEYVPVFVYRDGALSAEFPETEMSVQPPKAVREKLRTGRTDPAMTYSDSGCLYFYTRSADGAEVFGGPVPMIWIDDDTLRRLMREYLINEKQYGDFTYYMSRIPPYRSTVIGKKLNLLRFMLTGRLDHAVSLDMFVLSDDDFASEAEKTELLYETGNQETYNNSMEIENQIARLITDGDVEGFERFVKNLPPMSIGKVASTGLRSVKNNTIISTTLACRAAIAAGMPHAAAYALSDAYINEVERRDRVGDLTQLNAAMIREYVEQVHRLKTSYTSGETIQNRMIQRCVNYIHRNLNHRITVEDVADHVKLSRSYLSATFSENMGVSLNRYILDAKLDEAASLLQYTDRPISDIAEYLCFSSQSHFQKAFKDKFGQTPRTYRLSFPAPQEK